jgi:hypothetical protein
MKNIFDDIQKLVTFKCYSLAHSICPCESWKLWKEWFSQAAFVRARNDDDGWTEASKKNENYSNGY